MMNAVLVIYMANLRKAGSRWRVYQRRTAPRSSIPTEGGESAVSGVVSRRTRAAGIALAIGTL